MNWAESNLFRFQKYAMWKCSPIHNQIIFWRLFLVNQRLTAFQFSPIQMTLTNGSFRESEACSVNIAAQFKNEWHFWTSSSEWIHFVCFTSVWWILDWMNSLNCSIDLFTAFSDIFKLRKFDVLWLHESKSIWLIVHMTAGFKENNSNFIYICFFT